MSRTVDATRTPLGDPLVRGVFAAVRRLLVVLFVISLAAVVFAIVMSGRSDLVNAVVWIRSIAVVAAAVILYGFAMLAERGRVWAYRRLRLLAYLIPCGVVLLIAAPGEFPLWIKIEQGVCGAVILAVAILLSRSRVRAAFPAAVSRRRRP